MDKIKFSGLPHAILSGLLLNLIFPRWEWPILAWIALIPLFLALTKSHSFRNSIGIGFSCGLVYFTGTCFWITNTMINYGHLPAAVSFLLLLLLASYMSLYVAAFSLIFFFVKKRYGMGGAIALAPFSWTFLEYSRTFLFTGFPWNFLGYSQYKALGLIQFADITGIYGVSFYIVLMNGFLFWGYLFFFNREILKPDKNRADSGMPIFTALTLIISGLVYFYGNQKFSQYAHSGEEAGLSVSLIQGNIDQNKKWDPAHRNQILESYKSLTVDSVKGKSDLVIWPETAIPFFLNYEREKAKKITAFVKKTGVYLLAGSPSIERTKDANKLSNSAYFISEQGLIMGRYDKVHLVPFGEYVPLKKALWFVDKMVQGIGAFHAGDEPQIMQHPKGRFGVLICFEIIFPELARWNAKKGAEFLVNITNDAWFGKSGGPYQHLSKTVFRAIENRLPVVRAANTGISAIINQRGEIESTADIFVRKTVSGNIFPDKRGKSFYTENGDIFSYFCGTIVVGVLLFCFFAKPEEKRI